MEDLLNIFTSFSWTDALDILILAAAFYFVFKLMKLSSSGKIVGALVIVLCAGALVVILKLPATSRIFAQFFILLLLFFGIIYSTEIKREIWKYSNRVRSESLSGKGQLTEEELEACVQEISKAVQNLAKKDIGALIVMCRGEVPAAIVDSGTVLNAQISSQLLESIFFPKTPLHDGAVLIKDNKIVAAGCFLPLSQELNLPKEIGTRHRAGIGISETHNVLSVVVSEETGIISMAMGGKLQRYVDSDMLKENLRDVYGLTAHEKHTRWGKRQ